MNEREARKILKHIALDDRSLYTLGTYIEWKPDEAKVVLDGSYTAEKLEAIAWWMRKYRSS